MRNNYTLPTIAGAKRLAEQAQLNAELAEEKTHLAKMKKPVDDTQESDRVPPEKIKWTDQ